jgi:uncharacterized protein YkwD
MTAARRNTARPRILASLLALTGALVGFTLPAAALTPDARAAASCAAADATIQTVGERALREATLCLMNRERRAHGRRSLRLNARLTRAAETHAESMVRQTFLGHVTPTGLGILDRILATSYVSTRQAFTLAENLGWGPGSAGSPRRLVSAWMRSPLHRRNLLRARFRDVGIGIAAGSPRVAGGQGTTYAVEFGRRSGR